MIKRLLGSRVFIAVISAAVGASLAGGVAWAAVVVPHTSSDQYFACVGVAGKVRQETVRFKTPPAKCPSHTDTIRAWNAQGPVGPPGPSSVATLQVAIGAPFEGTVSGPGIQCSGFPPSADPTLLATDDCTEVYPVGTTVVLVAGPNSALTFAGWSGACSGTSTCSIVMTGAKSVTANFASVSLTKTGVLLTDNNANGTLSPGDVVSYTLTLKNMLAAAIPNQVLTDAVGMFGVGGVRTATLIAGSVTTTAGSVTAGNAAGAQDVTVTVPSLAANATVTVKFRAIAHPKTASAHGITFGPFVQNTAWLNGNVQAVDPSPPTSGPCAVINLGETCLNADAAD